MLKHAGGRDRKLGLPPMLRESLPTTGPGRTDNPSRPEPTFNKKPMIDGFTSSRIEGLPDHLLEVRLTQTEPLPDEPAASLTVILAEGPPDPNALSYLIPRHVFERGHAVHVGALGHGDENLLYAMYELLEVMNADDIAVFLCEDGEILNQASKLLLD